MNKKSKKARQKWWKDLSDTKRHDYIEGIVKRKAQVRIEKSLKIMNECGQSFDCAKCFHGQGGNCTSKLPNGCEYWYNPKGKRLGIAERKHKKKSRKQWLAVIKKKNPWLKVA